MVIFYVYMRERAKKSPFYVAYTQIDEETFACEGKNFANCLTRVCVYVTEPKKSLPKSSLFLGSFCQRLCTYVICFGQCHCDCCAIAILFWPAFECRIASLL